MEHDFEDIEVKENAVSLLEKALLSKRKKCMIGTGSMTDPYIPLEEKEQSVRKSLELIYRYGFGFTVITKSDLILRDIDLLQKINERAKCVVQMTLTTADEELCKKLEPNVAGTKRRYEVLKALQSAGIPTVVWLCPILPFINDTAENISGITEYCLDAGVRGIICFGMGLTLRDGNREYFYSALDRYFPGLKETYIKLYGNSYQLTSLRNMSLMKLLYEKCDNGGIMRNNNEIFRYLSTFESKARGVQLSLFD